jgi:hypothetical protein
MQCLDRLGTSFPALLRIRTSWIPERQYGATVIAIQRLPRRDWSGEPTSPASAGVGLRQRRGAGQDPQLQAWSPALNGGSFRYVHQIFGVREDAQGPFFVCTQSGPCVSTTEGLRQLCLSGGAFFGAVETEAFTPVQQPPRPQPPHPHLPSLSSAMGRGQAHPGGAPSQSQSQSQSEVRMTADFSSQYSSPCGVPIELVEGVHLSSPSPSPSPTPTPTAKGGTAPAALHEPAYHSDPSQYSASSGAVSMWDQGIQVGGVDCPPATVPIPPETVGMGYVVPLLVPDAQPPQPGGPGYVAGIGMRPVMGSAFDFGPGAGAHMEAPTSRGQAQAHALQFGGFSGLGGSSSSQPPAQHAGAAPGQAMMGAWSGQGPADTGYAQAQTLAPPYNTSPGGRYAGYYPGPRGYPGGGHPRS